MSLQELISTYGYAAIGIGTFLEGETILILGGFSAHRGYLELPWVILCAFAGTFFGDQFYFYFGRAKGQGWLKKRPGWQQKSEKVFLLLAKHQVLLILGFRFLYGLRSVTPFVIGMAGISPARFFVLNFIGALVWAVTFGAMGYLFGHALEIVIDDIKRYELLFFGGLIAISLALWLRYLFAQKSSG